MIQYLIVPGTKLQPNLIASALVVWNNVDHSCHSWFPQMLKQTALRLTAKWEQPYSRSVVREFVNVRINLAILGATNLCIRGYFRVAASKISKRVEWLDDVDIS
jgi:hypothetical protein